MIGRLSGLFGEGLGLIGIGTGEVAIGDNFMFRHYFSRWFQASPTGDGKLRTAVSIRYRST